VPDETRAARHYISESLRWAIAYDALWPVSLHAGDASRPSYLDRGAALVEQSDSRHLVGHRDEGAADIGEAEDRFQEIPVILATLLQGRPGYTGLMSLQRQLRCRHCGARGKASLDVELRPRD
jgi:hypothetical protein